MSYKNAFKAVMRDYDRARSAASKLREERKRELCEKIPGFEEIGERLEKNALKVIKLITAGEASREEAENFKAEALELKRKKSDLLKKYGYSEAYLDDVFSCSICNDTGYISNTNEKCRCFKQRLMDKLYDASTIRHRMGEENFDTFDIRYYSKKEDPSAGVSPYANIQVIYSASIAFASGFGKQFENLLFYGDTGLGKTFLCNCISKEVLEGGHTVLYVTAPQIFKKLEDRRFNREEDGFPDEQVDMVFEADLLVIDDLGSEFSTVVTGAELFNIVNTRIIDKKPTIISTNLSLNDLQSQYSDRIVSRLFGNYRMLRFFGEDIRLAKKLRGAANS